MLKGLDFCEFNWLGKEKQGFREVRPLGGEPPLRRGRQKAKELVNGNWLSLGYALI